MQQAIHRGATITRRHAAQRETNARHSHTSQDTITLLILEAGTPVAGNITCTASRVTTWDGTGLCEALQCAPCPLVDQHASCPACVSLGAAHSTQASSFSARLCKALGLIAARSERGSLTQRRRDGRWGGGGADLSSSQALLRARSPCWPPAGSAGRLGSQLHGPEGGTRARCCALAAR